MNQMYFVDAAGVSWFRKPNGELAKVNEEENSEFMEWLAQQHMRDRERQY
jgi:hypothetical protein